MYFYTITFNFHLNSSSNFIQQNWSEGESREKIKETKAHSPKSELADGNNTLPIW